MMRFLNCLGILLCLATVPVFSRADEPPAIPKVKTIDNLRKLPPCKLSTGAEVRIGITDATEGGAVAVGLLSDC